MSTELCFLDLNKWYAMKSIFIYVFLIKLYYLLKIQKYEKTIKICENLQISVENHL